MTFLLLFWDWIVSFFPRRQTQKPSISIYIFDAVFLPIKVKSFVLLQIAKEEITIDLSNHRIS